MLREVEPRQVRQLFPLWKVETVIVTAPGVADPVRLLDDDEVETRLGILPATASPAGPAPTIRVGVSTARVR